MSFDKIENPYRQADKEKESPKVERWKAPSFEDLKKQQNNFKDNRADILGFLKIVLLEKAENGSVSARNAKDYFQSLLLSDSSTFLYIDELEFIKKGMYKNPADAEISLEERERARLAFESFQAIPRSKKEEQDDEGFFATPKFTTSTNGVFLTNAYRCPENGNGRMMDLESLGYRVNFGCSDEISNIRVLMDLFEVLRSNPVLAAKGFRMKTLGNNRTDAVIIYCGEEGVTSALEEVVNYCMREGIDCSEQGVPLGAKPIDRNGQKMRRISVTSSPGGGFTFNDLQVRVLLESFRAVVDKFLGDNFGPGCGFDNVDPKQLLRLLPEIKNRNTYLLGEIEHEYEKVLRKYCKDGSVDMHNLAFPFAQDEK